MTRTRSLGILLTSLALALLLALGCSSKRNAPTLSEPAPVTRAPDEGPAADKAPDDEPTVADVPGFDIDDEEDEDEPTGRRRPDVHFVPTPKPVVKKMLETARVTKDDLVYDLGCGDGRIVIAAARDFGARAVGFDIDPERVAEARANVKEAGLEHLVTIEEADIFTLDLSKATVITLYLLPSLNVRLIPQLDKLPAGVRIVSHDFDMDGVAHEEFHTVVIADEYDDDFRRDHYVYMWTTPLKKEDPDDE